MCSGFTSLEQTIMDSGQPDRVIAVREDFRRAMAARYRQTIEELTGRKVLAFLSQAHVEPDIAMETFCVDGPLEDFRAVEIERPPIVHRRAAAKGPANNVSYALRSSSACSSSPRTMPNTAWRIVA